MWSICCQIASSPSSKYSEFENFRLLDREIAYILIYVVYRLTNHSISFVRCSHWIYPLVGCMTVKGWLGHLQERVEERGWTIETMNGTHYYSSTVCLYKKIRMRYMWSIYVYKFIHITFASVQTRNVFRKLYRTQWIYGIPPAAYLFSCWSCIPCSLCVCYRVKPLRKINNRFDLG